MCRLVATTTCVLAIASIAASVEAQDKAAREKPAAAKVYGEWLIRVHPDKGAEYNALIEKEGLPLFRQAGGRMVGWWNTLIGNLYEHVTIWEYDDMAAFEKAVQFLGGSDKFAEFVKQRDPLLDGEDSRFLRLASTGEQPGLPESARFVIHELHRVPLQSMGPYLGYMEKKGLPNLKKHGFRPVGPFQTEVGDWLQVTYLFRFESLAQRDRLIAAFKATPEGQEYIQATSELANGVTTRLLVPAPFARP
jgi:hypothetical protein